jgi:opacity protein-like surface antigen
LTALNGTRVTRVPTPRNRNLRLKGGRPAGHGRFQHQGVALKRAILAVALAGTALVSLPLATRAQVSTATKPVEFGIAAGASIPMSDLSDATNTGFNVTGILGFHPQMIPLGVRIDVAYNRFGIKSNGAGLTGDFHFTSVTGNLEYSIPSESVSPYLIGGAGLYNQGANINGGTGSSNKFGWNLGGGIKLPLSGFDTFLEARYNQIQESSGNPSLKFIPITFGVLF